MAAVGRAAPMVPARPPRESSRTAVITTTAAVVEVVIYRTINQIGEKKLPRA